MKQLSRFENLVGGTQLDDETKRSLLFMRDRVLNAEPRKLLADVGYVYHLYTDACFEAGGGGLGGVLFDGSGNMLSFFSEKMSDAAMGLVNPLKKIGSNLRAGDACDCHRRHPFDANASDSPL